MSTYRTSRRRLVGALWPSNSALLELRLAALTVVVMAVGSGAGRFIGGQGTGFDHAFHVSVIAALVLLVAAWDGIGKRLATSRIVRLSIAPLVVIIGMLAVGGPARETLAPSPTMPLLLLALLYAAVGPGFAIVLGLVAAVTTGYMVDHATLPGHAFIDAETIAFAVRSVLPTLATGAMCLIIRQLRRERRRADELAERQRARASELRSLHSILVRFDGSAPLGQVLDEVVGDMGNHFGLRHASIYLSEPDGALVRAGHSAEHLPLVRFVPGGSVMDRAARTRETQFVAEPAGQPDRVPSDRAITCELSVPLVHADQLLGVLNVVGTADHPLTVEHVTLAEMIGGAIAAAIRTARLDEERRERLESIERVLAVSRELGADLDRARVIASVCEAARDLLRADVVGWVAPTPDGEWRMAQAVGLPGEAIGGLVEIGQGLLGRALEARERVVRAAAPEDLPAVIARLLPAEVSSRHGVAVPIEIGNCVAGLLLVVRVDGDRGFSELELRIADLLMAQATIAVRNAELHQQVADAAVRDPLTGLLNRRYFDAALVHAFAAARRSGAPLSVIVLDLDRFSSVNNEHGHVVGDAVLRRVADALRVHVREADIVARYGGEEFVVIAPGATRGEALEVAERIRSAVARTSTRAIDGIEVPIALSAGVASMLGDERDAEELFRAADSGLLAAKRAGRDRVVAV